MERFKWEKKYETGIGAIDKQHQVFFVLLDKLESAFLEKKADEVMNDVLVEVLQYTETHFSFEEKMMRDKNYTQYEEHKAIHEKFTEEMKETYEKYSDGMFIFTISVIKSLRPWPTEHILETDQKFGPFLRR